MLSHHAGWGTNTPGKNLHERLGEIHQTPCYCHYIVYKRHSDATARQHPKTAVHKVLKWTVNELIFFQMKLWKRIHISQPV